MEPPVKKRRRGSSPPKPGQNDDEDDELASHPQEISVRRDPDIQLALKRANADHKLQATMAHIIEKYSRDFEGVGDEIDMETGEIVVNNGHLHNMRDEGDVEGLWMDGDSNNEEEDEGILLEDLTDEYSDNQDDTSQAQDIRGDGDDIEHANAADREPEAESTNKDSGSAPVPVGEKETTTRDHDHIEQLLQDAPLSPHGGSGHPHAGFGPPSFGPGASPFGYGAPQTPFNPWAMMSGFTMNAWGRDDIPPYYNMPPSIPGPWFSGGRYEFPTNNGQTSIWGRGWAKKTKRAGSMKRSSKPLARSSEQPGESPTNDGNGGDRSNVQTSSEEKQRLDKEHMGYDRVINASDEDDDLVFSGATDPPSAKSMPATPKEVEVKQKDSAAKPIGKALKETAGNVLKVPTHDNEKDDRGCRRSGRARKQVEYMGKISWADARELRKSGQILSIELHRADPTSWEEFESVDDTDDEQLPIQESAQPTTLTSEQDATKKTTKSLVVPDSQDTCTPFSSSAPQVSQSRENISEPSTFGRNIMPTMVLSDDEAPLPLSKVKPPKQRPSSSNPVPESPSLGEKTNSSTTEATVPETKDPHKSPSKSTPQPESKVAAALNKVTQSLKRKRGRPRKSDQSTIVVATDASSNTPRRKPGRPRKPDLAVEEDNKVRPLSHEVKWLQKKMPKGVCDLVSQGAQPGKQLRPRRSNETLEPVDTSMTTPEEASKEPEAVLNNKPPSPTKAISTQKDEPPPSKTTSPHQGDPFPSNMPRDLALQLTSTPKKPKGSITNPTGTPSNSSKPHTPRHTSIRTTHAPSSRRSLLSFVSDSDSDSDRSRDELTRGIRSASQKKSARPSTHKIWRSTALTTEVHRTPSRRSGKEPCSPSTVKTPGGTMRTCGTDGFQCGRDFCFTCL
ncbi:hypothetical protein FDECE_6005 [Fusarium decemcellulare]|nr:hypothetical protein FDECE_6005 [Fusarium decemcellulare]